MLVVPLSSSSPSSSSSALCAFSFPLRFGFCCWFGSCLGPPGTQQFCVGCIPGLGQPGVLHGWKSFFFNLNLLAQPRRAMSEEGDRMVCIIVSCWHNQMILTRLSVVIVSSGIWVTACLRWLGRPECIKIAMWESSRACPLSSPSNWFCLCLLAMKSLNFTNLSKQTLTIEGGGWYLLLKLA